MKLFEKTYDGESLVDLGRDVHEAFDADFNPLVGKVPVDQHGFMQGRFVVSIHWMGEE